MKVGSLVFATDQGLGRLAKDFYDNGVVTHPMVVAHGRRPEHREWFPGAPYLATFDSRDHYNFAEQMDVMLFFETPFDWHLINHCKLKGVPTALMPMHECMPERMKAIPDHYICPSQLALQWAWTPQARCGTEVTSEMIPVPVGTPWRQRHHAHIFIHNAGHGGLNGRNGTQEVMEAWPMVKSPITLIVRHQGKMLWQEEMRRNERGGVLSVRPGNLPYESLWAGGGEGDVFLFPEKHCGLSLSLQEARAAGMLVMATNRYPMTTWLPHEPLIEPSGYRKNRLQQFCVEYDEAVIEPAAIAAKIDEWFDKDIAEYSRGGREWAETMSWEFLKPRYIANLERLANK